MDLASSLHQYSTTNCRLSGEGDPVPRESPVSMQSVCLAPLRTALSRASLRQQPAQGLSRPAIKTRDAVLQGHLPQAESIASASAWRLFQVVKREDLIPSARQLPARDEHQVGTARAAGPARNNEDRNGDCLHNIL